MWINRHPKWSRSISILIERLAFAGRAFLLWPDRGFNRLSAPGMVKRDALLTGKTTLMNQGGKLIAASDLVAASVSRYIATRIILANFIATSVTGDLDAVRLGDNATNLVAAPVGKDFVRQSELAEQIKNQGAY
jgi:hypothetical protein